jgi:hypothetical protein
MRPDRSFPTFVRSDFSAPQPKGIRAIENLTALARWLGRRPILPDFENAERFVDYVNERLASPSTRSAAHALWKRYMKWRRQ